MMRSIITGLIILLTTLFCQDAFLFLGEHEEENQTLELWLDSTVDMSGFHTSITGIHIVDVITEDVLDCGWVLFGNPSGFIAMITFLMGCDAGLYHAATLHYDYTTADEICITDSCVWADQSGLLLVVEGPCSSADYCLEPGDINGDVELDILDVVSVVECILQYSECFCADLTGDGTVDVVDIVMMIATILEE